MALLLGFFLICTDVSCFKGKGEEEIRGGQKRTEKGGKVLKREKRREEKKRVIARKNGQGLNTHQDLKSS